MRGRTGEDNDIGSPVWSDSSWTRDRRLRDRLEGELWTCASDVDTDLRLSDSCGVAFSFPFLFVGDREGEDESETRELGLESK